MKSSKRYRIIPFVSLCLVLLAGCLDGIRYNMPCQMPGQLGTQDVIGRWHLEYEGFINPDSPGSSRISGIETLVMNPDGTYEQMFDSSSYNYKSSVNTWELITEEKDGPKLAMVGLRYFANGVDHSDDSWVLSLQMPDRLRYQDSYPVTDRHARIIVNYPQDGFVYLYPRKCLGKLVLLQMVSGHGDPDDLAVHNPVFVHDDTER